MLSKLGYKNIKTVVNGEELVDVVKNKNLVFDVVFCDLMMPVMDGIEACRTLRSWHEMKTTIDCDGDNCDESNTDEMKKDKRPYNGELPKFIAVTANAQKSVWKECIDVGMSGFIAKPVTISALQKSILEHFGK